MGNYKAKYTIDDPIKFEDFYEVAIFQAFRELNYSYKQIGYFTGINEQYIWERVRCTKYVVEFEKRKDVDKIRKHVNDYLKDKQYLTPRAYYKPKKILETIICPYGQDGLDIELCKECEYKNKKCEFY